MENEIIRFLSKILAYGGGGAAVAYCIFSFLGKKWIENRFSKRLEEYRHAQYKELEELRFKITTLINKLTKIHEKEFEVLPKSWAMMQDALGQVSSLASVYQEFPDLNRMAEDELNEFLSNSRLYDHEKKRLLDKYREHLDYAQGGIFTKGARERLLGLARPYGGNATLSTFWSRQLTYVENALVDLELFIETAPKDKVDKVITAQSLTPIIQALFWAGIYNDKNRAEIAQLFIQMGFTYLESSLMHSLSQVHQRSITEAIDLSRILVVDIALKKGRMIE